MRKKLVKQGHNTLTITIPAKWVQENKLKAGDELNLDIDEDTLKLSPLHQPKEESIEIDVTTLSSTAMNWLLAASYKKGYDKVIVKYKNKNQLKNISKRIKECLKNYEIVEQSSSTITIKAISNSRDEEFKGLLRRIFLVNLAFFKSIQEVLEKKKYEETLESIYLEETNDSLVNTCQRIIIKNKKIPYKEAPFLYVIIWQLEKIADSLKHFCQDLSQKKDIDPTLVSKFKDIVELYESFYIIFYTFDQEKLDRLIEKKKEILSKFKSKEDFYLRQLSEQILDLSGSFFALNL